MTSLQKSLYFREWGRTYQALLTLGFARPEAAQMRHTLHIRALGYDKSSKDLTNPEFDSILAVFRSYSQPDDLRAQLRIQDQPEHRLEAHRERAHKLASEAGVDEWGRESYIEAIAQRVIGRSFERCSETEVAKICGILALQARRHARDQVKAGITPF